MVALKEGCVERCPGCSHRSMSMQQSLAQKEEWITRQLGEWKERIESIRSVEESRRWGYRRKILLRAEFDNNHWNFGMIRRDEFIAIPGCPNQSDALVTLVLKTKQMPPADWLTVSFINELQSMGVKGLSLHLNPSAGRRMFAKSGWHLLWGDDHTFNLAGLVYGRTSFSQLIHDLHCQSLDETEDFLDPGSGDCVVDLYSGIGSSLVRWIQRGAGTVGIETGGEAVACAKINAPQALILRGTCRQRLPQLQQWIDKTYPPGGKKLLYVNPPRTGIEPEVLKWIAETMMPDRMAYLSCSAGTLQRDLDRLVSKGFEIKRILPYDFFPQTHHVECLVLAEREKAISNQ
jgi:23S rRNA (uracil1939-C5)-methyltransferase